MPEEDRVMAKEIIGRTIVSKTGKKFGEVGDVIFEARSGELIHMIVKNPTTYSLKLDLEKDKDGSILIPFSSVIAMGDYMVVAEEDII
jgi:sporulation protein YlmC with PRC-barrel domain